MKNQPLYWTIFGFWCFMALAYILFVIFMEYLFEVPKEANLVINLLKVLAFSLSATIVLLLITKFFFRPLLQQLFSAFWGLSLVCLVLEVIFRIKLGLEFDNVFASVLFLTLHVTVLISNQKDFRKKAEAYQQSVKR